MLEAALALRVAAADAVEWFVRRGSPTRLDLFPDTDIYWGLARAIRAGGPYEYVEWSDIPHFAIRTPGYPLLLAACQSAFGERTLPVRLVQAVLGVLCVYLVYRLAMQFVPAASADNGRPGRPHLRGRWTIPLIAAAVAAVNPHYLLMSSLVLSEAAFEPLMLASLLGLAVLWSSQQTGVGLTAGWRTAAIAIGTGAMAGGAVMVRPSWLLFIPAMLMAWLTAEWRRGRVRPAARGRAGRPGRSRGDVALVDPQCPGLRPIRADGALDGREPLRRPESPRGRRRARCSRSCAIRKSGRSTSRTRTPS